MTIAQAIAAYVVAAGLLTLTPGLDTALILRTAAVEGPKRAAFAQCGHQYRLPDLGRRGGPWVSAPCSRPRSSPSRS